jgi:hypothetical protein
MQDRQRVSRAVAVRPESAAPRFGDHRGFVGVALAGPVLFDDPDAHGQQFDVAALGGHLRESLECAVGMGDFGAQVPVNPFVGDCVGSFALNDPRQPGPVPQPSLARAR